MKKFDIMNKIFFLILLFTFQFGHSQDSSKETVYFEVSKIYPPFSITKERLASAKDLNDLNKHYTYSWVLTYISVEISTFQGGEKVTLEGKDHSITPEQKKAMLAADSGSKIDVKVKYLPDNNLNDPTIREINFSVSIDPERDASYPGGMTQLNDYLNENVINSIPKDLFTGYKLAAVKFTIDEQGNVENAHIAWSSEDEAIDARLLKTVNRMKKWLPAQYEDGTKVKQEFAFMIGNKESCNVNLLQVNRNN